MAIFLLFRLMWLQRAAPVAEAMGSAPSSENHAVAGRTPLPASKLRAKQNPHPGSRPTSHPSRASSGLRRSPLSSRLGREMSPARTPQPATCFSPKRSGQPRIAAQNPRFVAKHSATYQAKLSADLAHRCSESWVTCSVVAADSITVKTDAESTTLAFTDIRRCTLHPAAHMCVVGIELHSDAAAVYLDVASLSDLEDLVDHVQRGIVGAQGFAGSVRMAHGRVDTSCPPGATACAF